MTQYCADCFSRILPPLLYSNKFRRIISTDKSYINFTRSEFPQPPAPAENDLKTIKAAKLRMRVFGSRSYDVMRHVMLNGRIISTIPINDSRMQYKGGGPDGWEYAEGKEFENNSRPVTLEFE